MRNLLFLLTIGLIALTSTACRQKQQELPSPFRDPYLEGYIDAFVADAAAHGIGINGDKVAQLRIVKFVDSVEQQKRSYGQASGGEELAGACTDVVVDNTMNAGLYKSGERKTWQEIWISNSITGDAPTPALVLKELMYHELGHCLLGLDHAAQAPHRIMSPNVSGDEQYLKKNWGRLLGELFASQPTLVADE